MSLKKLGRPIVLPSQGVFLTPNGFYVQGYPKTLPVLRTGSVMRGGFSEVGTLQLSSPSSAVNKAFLFSKIVSRLHFVLVELEPLKLDDNFVNI